MRNDELQQGPYDTECECSIYAADCWVEASRLLGPYGHWKTGDRQRWRSGFGVVGWSETGGDLVPAVDAVHTVFELRIRK
jgi:hypothetical protein